MHCHWSSCRTARGCKTAQHTVVGKIMLCLARWTDWFRSNCVSECLRTVVVDKTHTFICPASCEGMTRGNVPSADAAFIKEQPI